MNLFIQKSMNANLKNSDFPHLGYDKIREWLFRSKREFKSDVSIQLYFRVPPSRSFIIPPGGYPDEMDRRPLQGPYLFGRVNTNFPEANFGYVQQYPINAVATPMVFEHPHQYDFLPRDPEDQKSKSLSFANCNDKEQKSHNRSYNTFVIHSAVTKYIKLLQCLRLTRRNSKNSCLSLTRHLSSILVTRNHLISVKVS